MVGKMSHCAAQNKVDVLICFDVVSSFVGQTRKSKRVDDSMPSSYASMKFFS